MRALALVALILVLGPLAAGEAESREARRARAEWEAAWGRPGEIVVISDVGGGAMVSEILRPDQLNVDAGGNAGDPFKAIPGHVLDPAVGRNLYLDRWEVIGPFDNRFRANEDARFGPELQVDLDGKLVGRDGEIIAWHSVRSPRQRVEPQGGMVGNGVIHYAWTEVRVPQAGEYWVALGADDHGKLWLNGKVVWQSSHGRRAYRADEWVGALEFKQGINELLFRCANDGGTTGWSTVVILGGFDEGALAQAPSRNILRLGANHEVDGGPTGSFLETKDPTEGGRRERVDGAAAIIAAAAKLRDAGGITAAAPLELQASGIPVGRLSRVLVGLSRQGCPWRWRSGGPVADRADLVAGDHAVLRIDLDRPPRLARCSGDDVIGVRLLDRQGLREQLRSLGGAEGTPLVISTAEDVDAEEVGGLFDLAGLYDISQVALAVGPEQDIATWLEIHRPTAEVHATILAARAARAQSWAEALEAAADKRCAKLVEDGKLDGDRLEQLRALAATMGPDAPAGDDPLSVTRAALARATRTWILLRGIGYAARLDLQNLDALNRTRDPRTLVQVGDAAARTDGDGLDAVLARESYSRRACAWIFHRLRLAQAQEERLAPGTLQACLDQPCPGNPTLDQDWCGVFTGDPVLPLP